MRSAAWRLRRDHRPRSAWRGAAVPDLRRQRESIADAKQADLWAAGYAVTAPGGHGTHTFSVPTIDDVTDIDAFIGDRVSEGADFIKLIIEDLSAYGQRRLPTLSPDQKAVVAASHKRDRGGCACRQLEDARIAIDAGADGLVHVFTDAVADDALVAAMKQRDAFVAPTLAVVASMAGSGEGRALAADARIAPLLTAEQGGTLAADFGASNPDRLRRAIDSVRRLRRGRRDPCRQRAPTPAPRTAPVCTTSSNCWCAGLTPAQAIAARPVPAKRFGIADRGRIAGHARLVLVAGNARRHHRHPRDRAHVENGYAIEREANTVAAAADAIPDETPVSDWIMPSREFQRCRRPRTRWRAVSMARMVAGGANGSKGAPRGR